MTDTLITRLRNGNLFADRVEAADRIEALQSRLTALEGQEPVFYQWRRKDDIWGTENIYHSDVSPDSGEVEVRKLFLAAQAAAQAAPKRPINCGTSYCSCIECVMKEPKV